MMPSTDSKAMSSVNNCGVCARPLVYATESITKTCDLCGKVESTAIYCPSGHYVCDACHSKAAIDVIRQILESTTFKDPMAILEQVMVHPSVPMHGPEHHIMVPGIILAAIRNAGYPIPPRAIEKALERAGKVPGGWCGLYGDCGAGVGVGIAVSVLTSATPLTGEERSLAIGATAAALTRMVDDQPRCCKRAARIAIEVAVDYLHERLGINLPKSNKPVCTYTLRNKQCAEDDCPYFDRVMTG
jgi:hypothetical protein